MNWFKSFWEILNPPLNPSLASFTPQVQQVLALSRKEAARFNHNFVGTEHLLLGLLALRNGIAVNVLQKMGVDLEFARAEVEKQIGSGPDEKMIGPIPFMPRVKTVLSLATKEARKLNHTYVGTEHLLLGLLLEGDGVAAHVLRNLNVDPDRTRQEILVELEPKLTPEPSDIAPSVVPPPSPISPPADAVREDVRGLEFRDPFPNFTPRAQQVLALSRKEADRFNHNFVGTEHLLLGLIALGQGTAVGVLAKMGLDLETVRTEVEKHLGKGPEQLKVGNIPYTPRVKKVLAMAAKEAKALNHTYLGTEHILLGILREGDGVAARVLNNLGVEREKVREEILRELDPNSGNQRGAQVEDATAIRPKKPMTPNSLPEPIDTTQRYDVYCNEKSAEVVVYRNVLFKGLRGLLQKREFDVFSEFIELELSDGKTVFIAKASVVRFCQAGAEGK